MLISKALPNLMNGVSQQPDALRYDTQCTAQENAYPSVVQGLSKRPPTEHICKTNLAGDANTFIHSINREAPEQYTVLIRDQQLRVYDLDGTEKTVEMGAGTGADTDNVTYLDTDNADTAIKAVTIADVTYIANTEQVTAMAGTTPASVSPYEALVSISQADDTVYTVTVKQDDTTITSSFDADTSPTAAEITAGLMGALNNSSATQSYTDATASSGWSTTTTDKVAQSFEVQTVAPITSFQWKSDSDLSEQTFLWTLYSDDGGVPGSIISSDHNIEAAGPGAFAVQTLTFSAPFTPVIDTPYWLVCIPVRPVEDYVPVGWMNNASGDYPSGGGFTATQFYNNAAQAGDFWFIIHQSAVTTNTIRAVAEGPSIYISSDSDFSISVTAETSENYIDSFKDTAQTLASLPVTAKDGMILQVEGAPDSGIDDYYVKFVTTSGAGTVGKGTWEECAIPSLENGLAPDAATMPHLLIKQANGTFVFKKADGQNHTSSAGGTPTYDYSKFKWGERVAGDTKTSPDPTFIGKTINNMFLFKNRFGILADENIILSEAGEYFNFFRFTVIDLLDTAVIDIASASSEVSILRHAMPLAEKLIVLSDASQFVLQSDTALSAKTVSISRATAYNILKNAAPTASQNALFFAFSRGPHSGVREYIPTDLEDNFEGIDISTQIPKYIPGSITKLAAANHESVVCCLTDGDTDAIYVYNYYNTDNRRIQSAWHRWEFGTGAKVLNIDFIGTYLYLTVYRDEGVFIEKVGVEIGRTDTDSQYVSRLDRRFTQATTGVSVSNAVITMPYKKTAGRSIEIITTDGERIAVTTQSDGSNQVTANQDMTGINFYAGEAYEMSYTFSDISLRQDTKSGGLAVMTDGRIQVRYGTVTYGTSGAFTVSVTPDFRDTSTHEFTGKILGAGTLLLGSVPLESGEFRFPVFSKANQVGITITNDTPLPSNILSAEYELSWNPRTRRM